jgi:hypothetical protein
VHLLVKRIWNGLSYFIKIEIAIFLVKFHENSSSGSRVACGRTDVTKLIVAFRNFAKAPEIYLARKQNKTQRQLAEHGGGSSTAGYRKQKYRNIF